ncbi:MAG: hypothetical protein ABSC08_01145 [Bryobacteraceae bacterium]|jgi:hypothetical protein
MKRILMVIVLVATSGAGYGTAPAAGQTPPAPGKPVAGARAEDLSSPDKLLTALYEVISGPAGQARDWERFRNLFVPGARLIPVARPPQGRAEVRTLSVDEYIARAAPVMEKSGFFEREIARREVRYGALLHAFSTYASGHSADDEKPFARGINSIQLFFDGAQWRVVTIYWDAESPERPLPAEFLP